MIHENVPQKAKIVVKDEFEITPLHAQRSLQKGGRKSQNWSMLQETNRTATHINSQWLWQYASNKLKSDKISEWNRGLGKKIYPS